MFYFISTLLYKPTEVSKYNIQISTKTAIIDATATKGDKQVLSKKQISLGISLLTLNIISLNRMIH
ncbi:MAG: hypothetical protein KZQ74_03170 [gamma proteobacterium symbiont of Bathyaustriella thionipta]|nr:hypothetical protein [gamma proteobacterium symbiont of Bathyaustriella thionipta]MCU7951155.1 hypothetical protein [gamma proteobacterium symbiont of Bathyaustriella thionipta]MCU7957663.1 hypothetical protein [gamma proteobacterium symbiont of Bathyaustriella thionipta]MCU7966187.1 hypothetical protein [gamma proteobacterium symbiont of Bathyaustriella thionipta]